MPRHKTSKPAQLTFDDTRKPQGRGGWRPNAGRPKGRTCVPHVEREEFPPTVPQHVTLKLEPNMRTLRDEKIVGPLRTLIALSQRADFRIVEFSIQHDHIHLINEAEGRESLAAGLQGAQVRFSKRINRAFKRHGDVFRERYHSRSLKTPREVRNALRYVLNNYRHHAEERGAVLDPRWLDPFSSAPWFDGWAAPVETSTLPARLLAMPRPTVPPRVWLLTTGWKRHGLIQFNEVPGTKRRNR